jgi:hypothetical protein
MTPSSSTGLLLLLSSAVWKASWVYAFESMWEGREAGAGLAAAAAEGAGGVSSALPGMV